MTKLQMHIIRTINIVHDKDTLKEICKEYQSVYDSDLREDYEEWRRRMQAIWKGDYKQKGK